MSRRDFLRSSALVVASAAIGSLGVSELKAQQNPPEGPIRIIMAGYGPPTTSFSLA